MVKDTDGIYVQEETYYAVFEKEIMSHFYEKKKSDYFNLNTNNKAHEIKTHYSRVKFEKIFKKKS